MTNGEVVSEFASVYCSILQFFHKRNLFNLETIRRWRSARKWRSFIDSGEEVNRFTATQKDIIET